jgi:hypothetical protein
MSDEFQTWKQHFLDQAKGLIPHQKKFYKVSVQQGGGGSHPPVKIVSPTEQIVERAKASLNQPPTVYDPVTGVMQQTNRKHIGASHKRKRKTHKKKRLQKKKISSRKTRPKPIKSKKRKKNTKNHKKKQKWL